MLPRLDSALVRATTGLILVGGESRRFGADKARHPVGGRPMALRVYDALSPLVGDVFVSVRVAGSSPFPEVEEVVDRYPGAGPLAGVHAGLVRCQTPWLLAVACDMPFLTTDALTTLASAPRPADRPVFARTPDSRLQPLCALYPVSALSVVEGLLGRGQHAVRDLRYALGRWEEVLLPQAPLQNVNRQSDLD